ncbi:MAG: hypothetical protein JSV80_14345 [Acidobacteriota bacterium]|nr:MAG: hypothetical protein JSV80_14345 [Acidobacteriota bacterium]
MATPSAATPASDLPIRRIDRFDRILHAFLMTSFLGLSLTGLPLLFAHEPWAAKMAGLLGGYGVSGVIHRFCAVLLIGAFLTHVGRLSRRIFIKKEAGLLWGPKSLVPQPRDLIQLYQHVRWFVGLGPRPKFDRFTYWEKFDYWAVFWGMGVIGSSGLMMWFPGFFSNFLPGWLFNIALLIHGEEALLAMVFIFTVHFFNGHVRPEKFPMDPVIFTGRLTEEELREERPAEYERLVRRNALDAVRAAPPPHWEIVLGRVVVTVAVVLGWIMVFLALWALFG